LLNRSSAALNTSKSGSVVTEPLPAVPRSYSESTLGDGINAKSSPPSSPRHSESGITQTDSRDTKYSTITPSTKTKWYSIGGLFDKNKERRELKRQSSTDKSEDSSSETGENSFKSEKSDKEKSFQTINTTNEKTIISFLKTLAEDVKHGFSTRHKSPRTKIVPLKRSQSQIAPTPRTRSFGSSKPEKENISTHTKIEDEHVPKSSPRQSPRSPISPKASTLQTYANTNLLMVPVSPQYAQPSACFTLVLEVKPTSITTDMEAMEAAIRGITIQGLHWGESTIIPVAYGIKKLQICSTIESNLVSMIDVEEAIHQFWEYVQSVDLVAINKLPVSGNPQSEEPRHTTLLVHDHSADKSSRFRKTTSKNDHLN